MNINIINKIIFCFTLLFGFNFANAQETVYSQVLVKVEKTNEIQRLADLDFDIDHYKGVGQNSISFYVTSEEIEKLTSYGFSFDDFEISDYDPEILNNNETEALSEVIIHPNPFTAVFQFLGFLKIMQPLLCMMHKEES